MTDPQLTATSHPNRASFTHGPAPDETIPRVYSYRVSSCADSGKTGGLDEHVSWVVQATDGKIQLMAIPRSWKSLLSVPAAFNTLKTLIQQAHMHSRNYNISLLFSGFR